MSKGQEPTTSRGKRLYALLSRIFRRIGRSKPAKRMARTHFYYPRRLRLKEALRAAENCI